MSAKKCCTMLKPLVYEYYVVPDIETNSTGNYFTPNNDYPDWIDYLDFYVSEDWTHMKVENNQDTFTCYKGNIIVWDPVSKSIEQVCKNQEEFEEIYHIFK